VNEDVTIAKTVFRKQEKDGQFETDELEPTDVLWFSVPICPAVGEFETVEFVSDNDANPPRSGGIREYSERVVWLDLGAQAHRDIGVGEVTAPPLEVP
jgi:hypothetical protein